MPLVRLQVRNEFGLGQPELYRETNREDPKAVLDGVAVAGLVGILRQLGDLADFAAEVFHGLQERVMTTASRSHKLMVRVQNIEASLPSLEKAVLAQTSHIHLAYTAGCEWHPRIKTARNHFIYDDLPQFIMDSYEECREPPRVHLLDKFDTGGPGSCLRRYSDPTFFKRVSAASDKSYFEKTEKARKSRQSKKKRSSRRNGELLWGEHRHSSSGRIQFISPTVNGRPSSTASTTDMTAKSDVEDHSNSFDSKADTGYIECVFHPSNSVQSGERDCKEPSSSRLAQKTDTLQSVSPHADDSISHDYLEKQFASNSSGVTWDEKEEIVESTSQACDRGKTPERLAENQDSDVHSNEAVTITNTDYNDILFNEESSLKPVPSRVQTDDIDSEPDNYMDALNTIETESENDLDFETKRELELFSSHVAQGMMENGVTEATSHLSDNNLSEVVYQTGYTVSLNEETDRDFPESLLENPPLMSEPHASNLGCVSRSDVSASEEITRDTISLTKETFEDYSGSLREIPPLTSESHASKLGSLSLSDVPASEELTRGTLSSIKETLGDFPGSLQEIPPLTSEPHGSNLGSMSPLSDVPASKEITKDLAGSHSSESPICEQEPHTCGNSVLDHPACTESFDGGTCTVNDIASPPAETVISFSGSKSSNLLDEEADRINNILKSEGTPSVSSGDHSVRFWTNGGLLGLEPSKPPDFSMSRQWSLNAKAEMDGGSSHNSMQNSNVFKEEWDLSKEVAEHILKEPSSRCLTSSHEDDQACISAKMSGGSQLSNGFSQAERNNNSGEIRVIAPGSVLPAAPDAKACTEPNQGNAENSSPVFGLGHRLLINRFHRKVSFNEKPGPYNSPKTGTLEQRGQNGIVWQSPSEITFKEQVGSGYPIESLPPSPPLEHMKISFHPVSGLETSKLKLKFPAGSNHRGGIRDMFPSFQLVPEASVPLDDSGSHSDDDDTFCRSSPYVSDDCPSPRSDYNSDQWESDETPYSSDHGVCDSSHRRSSTESMSSTKELGGVSNDDINVASGQGTYTPNGVEQSLSGPSLDLPSFDNVNPVIEQESNWHSECNNAVKLHGHAEPTQPLPPPPPLPPMQLSVSKPELDITNGTQQYVSEDAEHINYLSVLESSFFQQPRLTKVEQTEINHDDHESQDNIIRKFKDKLDQQKLNGQKEAPQVRTGKETDEREDFLYQIRMKSFNLRRTVKEKSNATTSPTTNVKVTAILEKANAIRQVVASDDGEDDDTWSDT